MLAVSNSTVYAVPSPVALVTVVPKLTSRYGSGSVQESKNPAFGALVTLESMTGGLPVPELTVLVTLISDAELVTYLIAEVRYPENRAPVTVSALIPVALIPYCRVLLSGG